MLGCFTSGGGVKGVISSTLPQFRRLYFGPQRPELAHLESITIGWPSQAEKEDQNTTVDNPCKTAAISIFPNQVLAPSDPWGIDP